MKIIFILILLFFGVDAEKNSHGDQYDTAVNKSTAQPPEFQKLREKYEAAKKEHETAWNELVEQSPELQQLREELNKTESKDNETINAFLNKLVRLHFSEKYGKAWDEFIKQSLHIKRLRDDLNKAEEEWNEVRDEYAKALAWEEWGDDQFKTVEN